MPTPGEMIVELVRKYEGCSLAHRRDELAALIARGVDNPAQVVQIKTNCGMFALGVFHEAGVDHKLLELPYKLGRAMAWIRVIGKDLKALKVYQKGVYPTVGSLLHYYTPGKNDNHVEFLLSEVDENGEAEHGGGGRPNNAISIARGNVLKSSGRPLQEWLDPDLLLAGTQVQPNIT